MAPLDRPDENDLFAALSHPLRRRILREMADGEETSPRELAAGLQQPLSNVSYHVRVLLDCGAIALVRTRAVRGSMQHFYRCTADARSAQQILGMGETGEGGPGESPGSSPP
jgi:DNA-binding transcriptional ArsR family regulator